MPSKPSSIFGGAVLAIFALSSCGSHTPELQQNSFWSALSDLTMVDEIVVEREGFAGRAGSVTRLYAVPGREDDVSTLLEERLTRVVAASPGAVIVAQGQGSALAIVDDNNVILGVGDDVLNPEDFPSIPTGQVMVEVIVTTRG